MTPDPASRGRRPRVTAPVVLALILLAMAAGQLADLPGFVEVLGRYPVGSTSLTWFLAIALIAGEVTGGVLLLRGSTSGAALALAVATSWSTLALAAFARGAAIDNCGCFGVYLAQPLRWWVLLEDVEFLALAAWVLWAARRRAEIDVERDFDVPAPRP